MAECFEKNSRIRSRSNRSSTSSTEKSPRAKKAKNQEEEIEDEPLTTPNMAGEFKDKLDEILEKVSKIDTVNETVKRIETSISILEGRLSKVEGIQQMALKDIEDLKESKEFMDASVSDHLKGTSAKLDEVTKQIKNYEQRMEELETKNLYLKAYSMRENVRFLNITEEEGEDVEEKLRAFLQDELEIFDDDLEIQRVHRCGKPKGSKPRAILARFLRYKDVEKILSRGKKLKGTEYGMFTDLPPELVERRRKLMPILKKAKQNKIKATFSKSMPDKLFVRGKEWQVGEELTI